MPTTLTNQKASLRCLLDSNIQALGEGSELLALLTAEQYFESCQPVFQSTIGAHFRHVVEHYRCFFTQLDSGVFCYDDRARDQLLEHKIEHAVSSIAELSAKLVDFDPDLFTERFYLRDHQTADQVPTSLHRELLFLQSHTVHHYALIAAMTRLLGEKPMFDFGVAIPTRTYLDQQAQAAREQPRQPDGNRATQIVHNQQTKSANNPRAGHGANGMTKANGASASIADELEPAADIPANLERNRCAR
ncbi:MAG: hypothetical protein HKN85_03645 [Gammaproteobacteria bacterium]|nr:hypothetical protein [Gammaproteobacteria bacterium]